MLTQKGTEFETLIFFTLLQRWAGADVATSNDSLVVAAVALPRCLTAQGANDTITWNGMYMGMCMAQISANIC